VSLKYQPENNNENPDQEHKNRNPVDRIHITDPGAARFVRILFPDVKIFCKFAKYAHRCGNKDK